MIEEPTIPVSYTHLDVYKRQGWHHKEEERGWYQNRVNAGLHLFSDGLFSWMRERGLLSRRRKMDLDREILKCLIPEGKLYAYDSPEYVKDMGTPERWYLSLIHI